MYKRYRKVRARVRSFRGGGRKSRRQRGGALAALPILTKVVLPTIGGYVLQELTKKLYK